MIWKKSAERKQKFALAVLTPASWSQIGVFIYYIQECMNFQIITLMIFCKIKIKNNAITTEKSITPTLVGINLLMKKIMGLQISSIIWKKWFLLDIFPILNHEDIAYAIIMIISKSNIPKNVFLIIKDAIAGNCAVEFNPSPNEI